MPGARLQERLGEASKKPVMHEMPHPSFSLMREAMPKREEWIAEAEKCEEEGAVLTCRSIIEETLGYGLDEDDDRKEIWMEDAEEHLQGQDRHRPSHIRLRLARVRQQQDAVPGCSRSREELRHERRAAGRAGEGGRGSPHRDVLAHACWRSPASSTKLGGFWLKAFKQNPDNEDIWLAAVKLEADNGETDQARIFSKTARQNAPTDRVWMRSVAFERQLGNNEAALDLAQDALQLFPGAAKLWMMKGQIYEALGKQPQARDAYGTGVRAVPSSVPLWLLYSRLEERSGDIVKARSVLDRARRAVPKSPELWCELIRVERRAGNLNQAKTLMASALQQMPKSGLLWTERILHLEQRTQRKALLTEAIKKVENDPTLLVTAGRILWGERKLDRAQNWFEKALLLDRDMGDTWAWYYKFLMQHGTQEKREDLVAKCVLNDPRHGEHWQVTAKDPRNAGKSTEEILNLVAAALS